MVGAERFSHHRQCLSATSTTICIKLQLVYINEHVSSSNIDWVRGIVGALYVSILFYSIYLGLTHAVCNMTKEYIGFIG